jgi:hypothetical protein
MGDTATVAKAVHIRFKEPEQEIGWGSLPDFMVTKNTVMAAKAIFERGARQCSPKR